ncbi:hypothetical protein Q7P37_008985 [Cladosporium fusiforme]
MRPSSVMFSALAGLAHVHAQDLPIGVMPKRQVVGTGVTTSSSVESTSSSDTTSDEPTTSETSATTPAPTTDDTETTTEPTSEPTADPTTSDPAPTTSSDDDESTTPSASPTSSQPEETSSADEETTDTSATPSRSSAVTTTDSEGSTITSSIPVTSSAPESNSAVRTVSDDDEDPVVVIGSSTIDPSTFESATTITSAIVRESTEPFTTTSYFTEDGQQRSRVVTSNRVVASTELATATVDPTLVKNGGHGSGGSSLSPQTKAIIGGVVGGIGGAILIGGIAIVAWRLWAKKKREQAAAVDDFGMGSAGSPRDSIGREKQTASSGHAASNSVDSYRNPNGAVNTASNF